MLLGFLVVLLSAQSSLGCTEESCLVATRPALKKDAPTWCDKHLPGPIEPREKVEGDSAMKRWLSSWKSQLAYNALKMYTILFINTAIGGMLGDIIGTMLTAFWPPQFPEQSIMKALMEWTQNYVQMALEKQPKEDIAGKMCTLKDQTDEVKKCTDDLVKKIKKLLGLFQNLLFSLLFVIMKQQLNFCSCSFHQIHLRWRQVHWPWIFHCWTNQKRPKFVVGLKGIGSDMCAPVVLSSFAGSQILWKSRWRSWRAIDRKDMVLSPHGFELHDVLPW